MSSAIKVTNVYKNFGSFTALNNVSLNVQKGQIYGFLGPNGAGKTTLIRCLMDYTRVSKGNIKILGHDSKIDSELLKTDIGFLSSDSQLYQTWTVQNHLDFVGSIKGNHRADELLKLLDLNPLTKVQNLSSGNKQKLSVILAFMGDPQVLIMDEPTRSLDPLLQNQLYDLIRDFAKKDGTVFFSSHNLSEVQQLCDNVSVIKSGTIVADKTIKDLLQTKVHLVKAITSKAVNPGALKSGNIEVIHNHNSKKGNSLELKINGEINSVIKILSDHKILDLEVTHQNLEDVFMEYYKDV